MILLLSYIPFKFKKLNFVFYIKYTLINNYQNFKNMNNNKIKICKYWEDGKCKKDKNECSFAHGDDDIRKVKCHYGINCYKEKCSFEHPEEWKFIKKSDVLLNDHKNDNHNILQIPNDDDFPNIIEINKSNTMIKDKLKYSEVINHDLNYNKNVYNVYIEDIKYKKRLLEEKEEKLDDWSLPIEEESKIIYEIETLKKDIDNLDNKIKKIDISRNEIHVDSNNQPEITIKINGKEIDNAIDLDEKINNYKLETEKNIENIDLEKEKVLSIINSFKKYFKSNEQVLKNCIKNTIKNDKEKMYIMSIANMIMADIKLLDDCYNDLI